MNCYICKSNNWHERKDLNPDSVVGICKECGNIAHILPDDADAKMAHFYKYQYRGSPNIQNIITTTRKLNYIKLFLFDYLDGKKDLVCGDVGCATGYLVNWFRQRGYKATGSELTQTFRSFSEHYYGIPITEELEPKHKYDLIVFYHTLEHMVNPYEKLMKHRELLNDDGVIMISVPEWMHHIEDLSAEGKLTIQNYFHKNHINCFTRQSFKNLLQRCGLTYVKEDYVQYGQTVLVKKCEPAEGYTAEDWKEVNRKIDVIKKAIDLHKDQKHKEAIDLWFKFPEAHLAQLHHFRKDATHQEHYYKEIIPKMEGHLQIKLSYAIWLYQYARYQEALKAFEELANIKPDETMFIYIAWTLERIGNIKQAMLMMAKAAMINPLKWSECENWRCKMASELPTWDIVAKEQLKEKLFNNSKQQPVLNDPTMS